MGPLLVCPEASPRRGSFLCPCLGAANIEALDEASSAILYEALDLTEDDIRRAKKGRQRIKDTEVRKGMMMRKRSEERV